MMRRFIVAVSGGVDSVVLLDMMAKSSSALRGLQGEEQSLKLTSKDLAEGPPPYKLIVAHFDHGIRDESADDATFVKSLAEKYGLPFETKREELGKNASEQLARKRRYAFLRSVTQKYDGKIVTAHHADDIVETIAINLTRGTGWRGLAVLDSPDIERPLLHKTKKDLINYAKKHNLDWHEDSTNTDTKYLRNSIRLKLQDLDDETKELVHLYHRRQVFLRQEVDTEIGKIVNPPYARYIFVNVDSRVASELLRGVLMYETNQSFTRPQLQRAIMAIKTLAPGKTYEVGDGTRLRFTRTDFVVVKSAKVVS